MGVVDNVDVAVGPAGASAVSVAFTEALISFVAVAGLACGVEQKIVAKDRTINAKMIFF